MSHTKEPWKYGKELTARSGEWLISMDAGDRGRGIPICETRPASGDEQANARRIVACVNACAGIPTEQLESGEARSVRDELADIAMLEKQRDELLDALERMVRLLEIEDARLANFGEVEAARATIASVKGGAA